MSRRHDHNIFIEIEDGGFEFYAMTSWLGAYRCDMPASMNRSVDVLNDLTRALLRVGWEIRLVMGRMRLFKPGDRSDRADHGALQETIPGHGGRADLQKSPESTRTTLNIERYLHRELRAGVVRQEPALKVESGFRGGVHEHRAAESYSFEVGAEDTSGQIAVVVFKVGIATSRVIAQVLSYMDAITAATGKPVLGILIAGGFHKTIVLATRAVPVLRLRKSSFQFSFEAVN